VYCFFSVSLAPFIFCSRNLPSAFWVLLSCFALSVHLQSQELLQWFTFVWSSRRLQFSLILKLTLWIYLAKLLTKSSLALLGHCFATRRATASAVLSAVNYSSRGIIRLISPLGARGPPTWYHFLSEQPLPNMNPFHLLPFCLLKPHSITNICVSDSNDNSVLPMISVVLPFHHGRLFRGSRTYKHASEACDADVVNG